MIRIERWVLKVLFSVIFFGALFFSIYASLEQNLWAVSILRDASNDQMIRLEPVPPDLSRARLWIADAYIESDRLLAADSLLESAVCIPADPLTCHYLGKIAYYQGAYPVSIDHLETARDFNSLMVYAEMSRAVSNYPVSEAYLEAAYRLFPEDAVLDFAQLLAAQDKFERASTILLRSINRFPRDFRVLAWKNLLGNTYLSSGEWELAESVFVNILYRSPLDLNARLGLGWAFYGAADLPRAYAAFTEALRIDPENWRAYYALGLIELKQENFLPAIEWFNAAVAHSSAEADLSSVYYELAWAYRLVEKPVEALNAIWKAIEASPVPRDDFFARQGAIYEWAQLYPEAIGPYRLALELNPENVQILERLRDLGNRFIKMTEWELAQTVFQEIIYRSPQDANAHLGLGWSYYGASDLPNAYQAFTASIGIDPENWQPYYALGLIEVKQSNFREAIEWFLRALEGLSEGDDPSPVYYELAWAYRLSDQGQEAVNAIEQTIELSPSPRDTYFARQGSIYEWLELYEEAAAAYHRALELNPDNIAAMQGLLRTEGE